MHCFAISLKRQLSEFRRMLIILMQLLVLNSLLLLGRIELILLGASHPSGKMPARLDRAANTCAPVAFKLCESLGARCVKTISVYEKPYEISEISFVIYGRYSRKNYTDRNSDNNPSYR